MMRSVSGVVNAMWQGIWRLRDLFRPEAERRGIGVAGLLFESLPVDGAAIEARRGPGLQAAGPQTQMLERFAEQDARPVRRCVRPDSALLRSGSGR